MRAQTKEVKERHWSDVVFSAKEHSYPTHITPAPREPVESSGRLSSIVPLLLAIDCLTSQRVDSGTNSKKDGKEKGFLMSINLPLHQYSTTLVLPA